MPKYGEGDANAPLLSERAFYSPRRGTHLRPGLKMRLVGISKRFNQTREGYPQMADPTRKRLAHYYSPGNIELKRLLPGQEVPASAECA